jgi:hypothetical protein
MADDKRVRASRVATAGSEYNLRRESIFPEGLLTLHHRPHWNRPPMHVAVAVRLCVPKFTPQSCRLRSPVLSSSYVISSVPLRLAKNIERRSEEGK